MSAYLNLSKRQSETLIVAVFFSSTIFFFGPLQIFFTNQAEFNAHFSALFRYCLAVTGISIFLLWAAAYPLKTLAYRRFISLLFVLSFLLWFQGNVLLWHYGKLDGKAIIWKNSFFRGVVDGGLWILFIGFGILKWGLIYRLVKKLSIALIAVQLIYTLLIISQSPQTPNFKKYHLDQSSAFNFSAAKNVIILCLDTFQSDVFQEIIEEDGSYRETFSDFIYFRNATSSFTQTLLSIPTILTSKSYDNSIPLPRFIKESYLSETSLPRVLKESGYEVDIFTFINGSVYHDESVASNFLKGRDKYNYIFDIAFIYDISLFRYLPHFIKKNIYNEQNWLLRRIVAERKGCYNYVDWGITKRMPFLATKSGDKGVFKFFHIWGPHPPYRYNSRLEFQVLPEGRAGYKEQAKGTLMVVKIFLDTLKRIGVYDNSFIFVIADHGAHDSVGVISPDGSDAGKISYGKQAYFLPLILVKQFNARSQKITMSDSPVCLSDVPATIFTALGMETPGTQTSIFKAEEGKGRQRIAFEVERGRYNRDIFRQQFLPPMEILIISGFSWLEKSLVQTGVYLEPKISIRRSLIKRKTP